MRPAVARALRVALSLLLVAVVVWWVDVVELGERLADVALAGALLVVLLHTGDRLLMAYKWRRLLLARGLHLGFGDAVRAYYVASFSGVFLPMTVGADLVRVGSLRRSGISTTNLLASVALERGLGALSQAVFCSLALAILVALRLGAEVPVATLAWAAAALILLLSAALPASFRVGELLDRTLAGRGDVLRKIGRLAGEYAVWRRYPGEIWTFLVLTFIEGFLPILTYWAAARAVGVDATVVEMAAVVPIVYLVARLPVPVSGIAVELTGFTFGASLLGMSEVDAAAISFLVSPLALLLALLPGAVAWVMKPPRVGSTSTH